MGLLSLSPSAGSQSDIVSRLNSALPIGWFGNDTPILTALLNGIAAAWVGLFDLLSYTQTQTRIATATDYFLDLVSSDYYGQSLPRFLDEPDVSFRGRISRNLLQPRATRPALTDALTLLTSRPPKIFEPARLADTGAYGVGSSFAYNTAGGYGSFAMPFQFFVTVYRPVGSGVANSSGYTAVAGGYGQGALQYTTPAMASSTILDSEVYSTVAATLPIGTVAWTAISN